MSTPGQPLDANYKPIGFDTYDPVGAQFVAGQAGTVLTAADGTKYAPAIVQNGATTSVNGTLQNAAGANGNGTALALLGMASVIFTVTMTGFTGTVSFQASEDNTNWPALQMQQEGTNLIGTSVIGSTTTAVYVFEGSVAGMQSVRTPVSGFAAGTVTVTAHAVPTTDAPRAINAVFTEGQRLTWSAAKVGLVPAASATDIFTVTGAANKVIRITHIEITAITTAATAAALDVLLVKRSAANTGGTSTGSPTPVPHDSANNALTAAATVLAYTANPASLGAIVGTALRNSKFFQTLSPFTSTDFPQKDQIIWDFGNRPGQALVLRAATDVLALNLNATSASAGASFDISIEWTEDNI